MKLSKLTWVAAAALGLAGCNDVLNVDPTSAIPSGEALNTAEALRAGVLGSYDALQTGDLYDRIAVVYPDLYADNLDFTGTYQTDREVGNRDVQPSNLAVFGMWEDSYAAINRANGVLAAIPGVQQLGASDRSMFEGEARFLRALSYFHLVRYFGGVPLVLEPTRDRAQAQPQARNTQAEVYAQVESDLQAAVSLLPNASRMPGAPNRASKQAAQALLARVSLEQGKHAAARDLATQVIGSGEFELVRTFRDLYEAKNTSEAILELQYTTNDPNSQAFFFFPDSEGGRLEYAPSEDLVEAFEEDDARLEASINTDDNYGIKYFRISNSDDNVIILRLAEMYLIRAEANARLGAPAATVRADIDVVRERAGLAPLASSADTMDELLDAVLQERRVEFAFEGHRFFDLRRMGRAQTVLDLPATQLLFPIPQEEIDVNSLLIQNPGY